MPLTYTLINSTSLSSSAASVTFSAIPATFDDLVLQMSTRTTYTTFTEDSLNITFNGNTASNYSRTTLRGNGSVAASGSLANDTALNFPSATNTNLATSNSFASIEMYIPSYRVSQNKPLSGFTVTETNATTAFIHIIAGLWRNTSAISSILITPANNSFASGSTFWLYGIKNS